MTGTATKNKGTPFLWVAFCYKQTFLTDPAGFGKILLEMTTDSTVVHLAALFYAFHIRSTMW